ncbi:ATP-dependent DNA helicase PIF1 [Mycena venus]|uniref:ATP-dependent DNA helicase PIF1 n=1 Tax=Mycena venus TaxID=2733690 RepID=A0A8H6X2Y5_9AGAR|nr:ATP-dependent DNA helicase PIF1 [Mycena venus]
MGQALASAHYLVFGLLYDQLFAKLRPTYADLAGRTYLITGSNSGLGLAIAVHLARLNPQRLILAVRSLDKGAAAKTEIVSQTGFSGDIDVWELDMESFASVKQFAERARTSLTRLDGAILNAGIHAKEWGVTGDGWERVLQVNILSTGLLGVLLLPLLQKTTRLPAPKPNASPQVLPHLTITGSGAQFRARFAAKTAPSILQAMNTPHPSIKSDRYESSKLFNLFLAREIAQLHQAEGVVVNVVHPGLVLSDIGRDYNFGPFVMLFWRWLGWTPAEGSLNLLYGVLSPTPPGAYIRTCQVHPPPAWVTTKAGAHVQKRVWNEMVEVWGQISPEIDSIVRS